MNIIPINEADAIILAYYDNGSMAYTLAEHPVMQSYQLTDVDENASFNTTWCSFSFIREVADEPRLIERGVLPYSHSDTILMVLTSNHNCVCSYSKTDEFYTQPRFTDGGTLLESDSYTDMLMVHSDDTEVWKPDLFIFCSRRIVSKNPQHYSIFDQATLAKPVKDISFRRHTKHKIVETDSGFLIIGDRCQLKITPKNYTPTEKGFQRDGVDSELRPVNSLWFNIPVDREYSIKTELEIIFQ